MSFDINKPYRTRDGRCAKAVLAPDGYFYGWRADADSGAPLIACWTDSGQASGEEVSDEDDLVNIPEGAPI